MVSTTSIAVVPMVLATVAGILEPQHSSFKMLDPASRATSAQWLSTATVEQEFRQGPTVSVATHASGKWRTLRRHGSVQSVTCWDPVNDQPQPLSNSIANEYIKVMASAYASLAPDDGGSHLYLGLGGGGALAMLLEADRDRDLKGCTASWLETGNTARWQSPTNTVVESDPDVVALATQMLGVDTRVVSLIEDDPLNHEPVSQPSHAAIFIDLLGANDKDPHEFMKEAFVKRMHDDLLDGGVFLANFKRGTRNGDAQFKRGIRVYAEVFGSCVMITSPYENNVIIAAVKDERGTVPTIDVEKAKRWGRRKNWLFNPESRLRQFEVFRSETSTHRHPAPMLVRPEFWAWNWEDEECEEDFDVEDDDENMNDEGLYIR